MTETDSLQMRCLALTGSFETSLLPPGCFSGIAGNFDGQGMSFGALQWNLGQKTLQPLLRRMLDQYGSVAAQAFGGGSLIDSIETMLLMGTTANQVAWAAAKQDAKARFLEPWHSCFIALGQTAEFQRIQLAGAAKLFANAQGIFNRFSLKTERGLALCFDIVVQNGFIGAPVEDLIRKDFEALDPSDEVGRLRIIANRRAEAAMSDYVEDVRNRKLTIANGAGTVHRTAYDLDSQFCIRLQPITPGVIS